MTNKGKEYAQQVILDGDKRLVVSVIVESSIAYNVEARLYDKDKQRLNNVGARVSSPSQALEAMQELAKRAMVGVVSQPGVVEGVSRKIRREMEACLFKAGVLARDDEGKVVTATVLKNRTGNASRISNIEMVCNMLTSHLRIPPFLGGLPMREVKHCTDYRTRSEVWEVIWANEDDSISAELRLSCHEMNTPAEGLSNPTRLAERLQKQLDEKLQILRAKHPGDFEVVCIDATGQEHLFDEGSSYLAENHLDKEFIWVFDRYGQRGEYSSSRFSKLPDKAKTMQPHIPGNHNDPTTGIVLDSLGGMSPTQKARAKMSRILKEANKNAPDTFDDAIPEGLSRILEEMNQ